jgi:ketosteroid isomerase-like protein
MSNIEEEFRDIERGWVAAYLQGDAKLFDRIWSEGFVFTFPFGQFTDKARELANIKSGDLAFESLSTDSLKVRVYGQTAVMTGRLKIRGHYKDRDLSGQYRYINVLDRRLENWRIVSSHAAHIA